MATGVQPATRTMRAELDVAGRYGFRRIEHVHIHRSVAGTTATVTGIAHRYPRTVRVPLGVAARLVAAGVPMRFGQRGERW